VPLPTGDMAWPPPSLDGIAEPMRQWSAWYAGDPAALREVYARDVTRPATRPAQYAGGVVGAAARLFWGKPVTPGQSAQQLHVPLAADICQASADLLFSEPPTLTVDGQGAQERLDAIADDGLHATLAEGAEVAAALGSVYLRVTWDEGLRDAPFLTTVHADAVVPTFRWGQLVAATIWHRVRTDGQIVWRHLERHELATNGTGLVLHGLYQGTEDKLGRPVPLAESPTTEGLAALVDADGAISTASPGLALVHIPNQRPHRRWRTHPLGSNLGRSDLDGVEGFMDALDEAWTSWMRDLRLAKARIIVPESMLTSHGPGLGTGFDLDREVFTPVTAMVDPSGVSASITPQQFAIRVEEHARTIAELTEAILRSAGYSAQTFGEGQDGAAITATEVSARNDRSDSTRSRKIRHWRPGAGQALTKLLAVDAAIFRTAMTPGAVDVAFSDGFQESPLTLAQTAQALRAAQAASTRTLVQMQHAEWGEDEVLKEIARIQAEGGMVVEDAETFGRGGEGVVIPGQAVDTGA